MFYETKDNKHGLAHDPFKSCVVPRPIGWITTVNADGVPNLAPFSFFNGVGDHPPQVMFAPVGLHRDGGAKDTLRNVELTGEFVANLVTWELREQMNQTSAAAARNVNEFELAGLATAPSRLVKPPRVKASPIHLECTYLKTVELLADRADYPNTAVFGKVVGIHISDDVITDGRVDMAKFKPVARLGYHDYTVAERVFTLAPPD